MDKFDENKREIRGEEDHLVNQLTNHDTFGKVTSMMTIHHFPYQDPLGKVISMMIIHHGTHGHALQKSMGGGLGNGMSVGTAPVLSEKRDEA